MTKSLAILNKSKKTKEIFEKQLKTYFANEVKISSYSVEEGINSKIEADIIIAAKIMEDEIDKYVKKDVKVIYARRSLSIAALKKLINIPVNKDVLFVNNARITLNEAISFINEVGIDHINILPYCPGMEAPAKFDLVVTTDEFDYIPVDVKKDEIINLGRRQISLTTIIEVLTHLDLLNKNSNILIAKYIKRLVSLIKKLKNNNSKIIKNNKMMSSIINNVSDGIVFVNSDKEVEFFNKEAENIFDDMSNFHKKIKEIFSQNLSQILKNESKIKYKNLNNKEIIIRIDNLKNEDEVLGGIFVFKDVTRIKELERNLRKKNKKKGYLAQYNFEDILGKSNKLNKAKKESKFIAKSESTVLISGESGVGKELFAQSIHNYSKRRNYPFVAINCSALPSDLLESELFGYEEGAFTGARKGGKAGIFEQAHEGTIFLDEIGNVNSRVQSKLLRVIEEKEVRRVGGSKVIPVNVRIIAATNKDLQKLIEKNKFREDLYYRLSVLPLYIPPLRERRADIPELVEFFLEQYGRENLKIPHEIMSKFYHYEWPGNIRELKNCIEYISQLSQGKEVKLSDLPYYLKKDSMVKDVGLVKKYKEELKKEGEIKEFIFILKELYLADDLNKNIGRRKIAENAKINNIDLSAQMVRSRINILDEKGLVEIGKGRQGTLITEKGISFLEKYDDYSSDSIKN
ncbi:MAG: sigma 54-interacting transcriptional regulator [Bacillota bacterium]